MCSCRSWPITKRDKKIGLIFYFIGAFFILYPYYWIYVKQAEGDPFTLLITGLIITIIGLLFIILGMFKREGTVYD